VISANIDHFLLGINNLEKGILEFEKLTGIKPVYGGVHPNIGTHNALVSLKDGSYLEIIAPEDPSKKLSGPFSGFENMNDLKLFGWAIGTTQLKEVKNYLELNKIENTGIVPGTRKTKNGEALKWETIFISQENAMSVNPFFIQWEKSSVHPSLTATLGCELSESIICNNNDKIGNMIKFLALDISMDSNKNKRSGLLKRLVLKSPKSSLSFKRSE
jgi:hypothetical protein